MPRSHFIFHRSPCYNRQPDPYKLPNIPLTFEQDSRWKEAYLSTRRIPLSDSHEGYNYSCVERSYSSNYSTETPSQISIAMSSGFKFRTVPAATLELADFLRLSGIAKQHAKELDCKEKRFLRLQANWRAAPGGKTKKERRGLMFCAQRERDQYALIANASQKAANDCLDSIATGQARMIQASKTKTVYTIPAKRGKKIDPTAKPFVPAPATKPARPAALVTLLNSTATASPLLTRPRSTSNALPDATSIDNFSPKKETAHRRRVSSGGEVAVSTLPPFDRCLALAYESGKDCGCQEGRR